MTRDLSETMLRNLLAAASTMAEPPQGNIGRYRIVREVGRGGMGVVYEAADDALGRRVALKLMLSGDEAQIARFEREARTVAKLSHPNIAAIHEVGEDAGRHFIAMQFVDGRTLAGFPRDDRRLVVRLVRDAALAVHYAHEQGIVHRDVKPSNLMVETQGGAPRLFVMDFGLAKQLDVDSSISVTGHVLGTPAYMPPEQARGRVSEVDARSDVYSLGATLYELLAGRAPFDATDVLELLAKVAHEEPRPIPGVERDLETIALKCLEKDPARRYASAMGLAADLTRWLEGEHILAHPPTLLYRAKKGLARKKGIVAAIAIALAVLVPWALHERARGLRAERATELWGRISPAIGDAETYARQGDVRRARAKLEEGVRDCRAQLAEDPTALGWYFLGRLLRAQGRREDALDAEDRAIALEPGLGEAHFERGLLRLGQISSLAGRDDAEARRLSEEAIRDLSVQVGQTAYFRAVDGEYGRAELLRLSGDLAKAKAAHQALLDREPLYAASLVALARIDYDRGEFGPAILHATAALAIHKGISEAVWVRCLAYARLADAAAAPQDEEASRSHALSDATEAIRLGDGSFEALVVRGELRADAGDAKGALADAEAALALQPARADALDLRGCARFLLGDYASAEADHSAAIGAAPGLARAWANRARARAARGNLTYAQNDWEKALSLDANDARAWTDRGDARLKAGDANGAIDDFGHAIDLKKEFPQGYLRRARARLAKGDLAGALADGKEATTRDKLLVEAWLVRADAYRALGEPGMALGELVEVLKVDKANLRAIEGKAWALWRLGVFPLAIDAATAVLGVDPGRYEARCVRARALSAQGNHADAVRDFDAALAIRADDPDVWSDRGTERKATGDADGAIEDWTRAIALSEDNLAARFGRGQAYAEAGERQKAIEDLQIVVDRAPGHWPGREAAQRLYASLQAGAPPK